jgi:hypothetical protein
MPKDSEFDFDVVESLAARVVECIRKEQLSPSACPESERALENALVKIEGGLFWLQKARRDLEEKRSKNPSV